MTADLIRNTEIEEPEDHNFIPPKGSIASQWPVEPGDTWGNDEIVYIPVVGETSDR